MRVIIREPAPENSIFASTAKIGHSTAKVSWNGTVIASGRVELVEIVEEGGALEITVDIPEMRVSNT